MVPSVDFPELAMFVRASSNSEWSSNSVMGQAQWYSCSWQKLGFSLVYFVANGIVSLGGRKELSGCSMCEFSKPKDLSWASPLGVIIHPATSCAVAYRDLVYVDVL